jgi:hypothetical protein
VFITSFLLFFADVLFVCRCSVKCESFRKCIVLVLWDWSIGHGKILVNAHVGVHMLAVGTMVHPIVNFGTIASARFLHDEGSSK